MIKAIRIAARAGVILSLLSCGAARAETGSAPKSQISPVAQVNAQEWKERLRRKVDLLTLEAVGDFEEAKKLAMSQYADARELCKATADCGKASELNRHLQSIYEALGDVDAASQTAKERIEIEERGTTDPDLKALFIDDARKHLRELASGIRIKSASSVMAESAETRKEYKIELGELEAGVSPADVEAGMDKRYREREEARKLESRRERAQSDEEYLTKMRGGNLSDSDEKYIEKIRGASTPGVGARLGSATSNQCPSDLHGIEAKLPDYDDPQLDALREQMLSFDTRAHFDNLISQGVTPQAIAGAAAEQAAEAEKAMPSVNETIREISDSPERVFSQLRDGTFAMSDGTLGQAGRAWALANYMVIANRETAVALACMAR